ncbi:hypothetical protein EDB92DRAFT_1906186 [Lactarius akahatsu]|uniref:Uncharacterized protein n=1 Tax=Lactarius akahatsu TaxID=416441 RepID=A0AAD4L941_9AGAM|nr:hypothetical protein EDB92DRAFT_1906186 [Lactarius akahatsu]
MHLRFAPSFAPMSHSPAPPPQLTNNTHNNSNSHTNSSPSQLAHILSTVLADNETLSKDLTTARARYERAEQTLTLLKPSGASLTAAADGSSPPPPPYPEAAVKAILDLQSRLETEKAAREAADSRLRTISEAWLDLDRYLQASEVHLQDARSHFSQLLRDSSTKPSFNPLPAYQPRRSHPPVPRASVAASQTFPSTAPAASLPARVRHRDDSIEDAPPAKRIRRDRGTRHPVEVRTCHTYIAYSAQIPKFQSSRLHPHVPPSYNTPEMNHHLHPAYPAQQPHPRGRRPERHDQSPSLSLSPARSRSSSMSLDELLLEATDNNRASPSSPQPGHAYGMPPSYYRVPSIRPSRSPDYRVPHPHRRETVPQPSPASPAIASPAQAQPPPQPQGQYQTLQTHIFAPPVTGPPGKKSKAGDNPSVTATPSARLIVGAASLPTLPPGGFPASNEKGQRICRQCGLPGRYKDGKCVEKWGPGPEGPGTVCDRCRKKMKRVERRGTLDPHSQNTASFVHPRVHAPVQERDHVHAASASQGSDRSIGRTDTVVVTHPPPPQHLQSFSGPPESREREAGSPRSNASSLAVPRPKGDVAHSVPSSRSRSRSPLPPPPPPQRNGSQAQPPSSKLHISSGGESDAEAEAEAEDPDADLLAAVDAAEASGGKAAIAPWIKREIEAV